MLFDEKDLRVFDNEDSRAYFKEILQSYYSQNYRATIVLLYSFVIYDLFMKLQTMANEGDNKAIAKLAEINTMISDDEKYSKVENEVVLFFTKNCPLYFERFIEDIEYLKNCRNKCAHLKVNDNSLFVPNDYHVRMLICSMFDNVLAVKAPFIMDLFTVAQSDVERYANSSLHISNSGIDEAVKNEIKNKYLNRMTFDSLKKSYKTFIRLLMLSDNEDCINNIIGLYVFVYAMTDFIVKEGFVQLFSEATILDVFSKIEIENLRNITNRRDALIEISSKYPIVMDVVRSNPKLFEYLSECVLTTPYGLCRYRTFYPREEKSIFAYFNEKDSVQQPLFIETLYSAVKESADFVIFDFLLTMVKAIPKYNGFYDADCFMSFFKDHLNELTCEEIHNIMKEYRANNQCTNRARNAADIGAIKKYLEEHQSDEPEA